MRINTLFYCLKQGLINIRRNKLYSLASVITIAACIFLFGVFFSVLTNIQYMIEKAEGNVGITVFFDENIEQARIDEIGAEVSNKEGVAKVEFISADEAWEQFKDIYFQEMPQLAEGFSGGNPLSSSASYAIYLDDVSLQNEIVLWLKQIDGVRRVNYSEMAAGGLEDFNHLASYVSIGLIGILLVVSIFLISNTISLAYATRKKEMQLMKWIGATNFFVRAPFVVEGLIIGLVGSAIPLVFIYAIYKEAVAFVLNKFSIISSVIQFLPVKDVFLPLIPIALLLGAGIGFIGSFFTIQKQLKV